MASMTRDLTPVIPKKNRSFYFCLVGLMSLAPLIAIFSILAGYQPLSPIPADTQMLPLATTGFIALWAQPVVMFSILLVIPLFTALLLQQGGIKLTAILGIIVGVVSIFSMIYDALGLAVRGDSYMYITITSAILQMSSIIMIMIASMSGIIQVGAQKTSGRRLLTAAMLSLFPAAVMYLLFYFCYGWEYSSTLYLVSILALAAWVIYKFIKTAKPDLSLDARDIQTPSCESRARCIGCAIIAFLSPIMIYSLQIYFTLNLARLISSFTYSVESSSDSFYLYSFSILAALIILRMYALFVYSKRGRLWVPVALLTGSLVPVKIAEYLPLRSFPILLPAILIPLSMLIWYVMMMLAKSVDFFILF